MNSLQPRVRVWLVACLVCGLVGCATESYRTVEPPKVAAAGTAYSGPRETLFVGQFDNRSDYMRGLFAGSIDRLGSQAKTIPTPIPGQGLPLIPTGPSSHGSPTPSGSAPETP